MIPRRSTGNQGAIVAGTGTRRTNTHAHPDTPTKDELPHDFPSPEKWDKMVSRTKTAAELNELQAKWGIPGYRSMTQSDTE